MAALIVSLLVLAVSPVAASGSPGTCQPLSSLSFKYPPTTSPGLKAYVIHNLNEPRGMRFDAEQNLLVVERYIGVTSLTYRNDSTCIGWESRAVVRNPGLEHGIEIGPGKGGNQYLYASTQEDVFRWDYDPKTTSVTGPPVQLVRNMTNYNVTNPPNHVTRTLLLQGDSKYLIVSRGSSGNIDDLAADVNFGPAQVRRFELDKVEPIIGDLWEKGELLGWGLRNAVGLALSKDKNSVWAVENGQDNAQWRGVDVHLDNPADELNLIPVTKAKSIPTEQKYYGYPSCFTAWNSSSVPRNATSPQFNFQTGEQFSVRNPPATPNDEWCADSKRNVPPMLPFEAHSAPLDIVFYEPPKNNKEGLPTAWNGDAIVGFHGGFDPDHPTGFSVVRVPWAKDKDRPVAGPTSNNGYEVLIHAGDLTQCPEKCIRPTGVIFDKKGRMFVSSDDSGEVFMMTSAAQ